MNLRFPRNPKTRLGPALAAALCFALVGGLAVGLAHAAPKLRFQVDQHGDMLMIGNTLGQECRTDITIPKPVTGTVGDCGTIGIPDSAPDVFWQSMDDGTAIANSTLVPAVARSSAQLTIPAGAQVSYARLYWGANLGEDPTLSVSTVIVDRPGVGAFTQMVSAAPADVLTTDGGAGYVYSSSADVTTLVQQHGAGAYRVGGLARINVVNVDVDIQYAAWTLVVFYKLPTDPVRNLALFDGLDKVVFNAQVDVSISGFLVPSTGAPSGKLGVIAYEGDVDKNDFLKFNNQTLTDALNPPDNFFNSTRSSLGTAVTTVGDAPQLTGGPGSMSGLDMDFIDITAFIKNGDTTAQMTAGSVNDIYFLAALATSVASTKPVIETDLTYPQGTSTRPGDTVELTSTTKNVGDDTGTSIVITQPIPQGLTYVPGSVRFIDGPDASQDGTKTDAPGDDQVDYDPVQHTLTIRIGRGANATMGGSLAPTPTDKPVVVKFLVKINDNAVGDLPVQSMTSATSMLKPAAGATNFPSGNGVSPGAPTVISVKPCGSNADCSVTSPVCDTTMNPPRCTNTCTSDAACMGAPGGTDVCSGTSMTCVQCSSTSKSACAANGPGTQCLQNGSCGCMTDADCGGRTCNVTTNTCPKPSADLSVTVTHVPNPPQANAPITYTVQVHNGGPATAPGPIVVTYTVPAGGTITSVTADNGWRCMVSDSTVTCTSYLPLPASSDAPPIKILVTPTPSSSGNGNGGGPAGVQINVTVASDGSTDPDPSNNSYSETTGIGNYRVAGGGFGCSLTRDPYGLGLWSAAATALLTLLGLSRLRRRRQSRTL